MLGLVLPFKPKTEMSFMRKIFKLTAAACCLGFFLLAQAQSAAQPPVRIALIESLSGAFANTGEAVFRNLVWASERVNARGGIKLADGQHPLIIQRYDSKGQNEEALAALRSAIDDGVTVIAQGNSSSVAAAIWSARTTAGRGRRSWCAPRASSQPSTAERSW